MEKSVLYLTETNTWDINAPLMINPEGNNENLLNESLVKISLGKKQGVSGWYMLGSQNNFEIGSSSNGGTVTIDSDLLKLTKDLTVDNELRVSKAAKKAIPKCEQYVTFNVT